MATLRELLHRHPIADVQDQLELLVLRWLHSTESESELRQQRYFLLIFEALFEWDLRSTAKKKFVITEDYDLKSIKVVDSQPMGECELFNWFLKRRNRANPRGSHAYGLRFPDLQLVARTERPSAPAPMTSTVNPSAPAISNTHVSPSATSSFRTVQLSPEQSSLPGVILEYQPILSPQKARESLGKAVLYLLESFEVAGKFLALSVVAARFIRIAALGSRHVIIELDVDRWPGLPADIPSFGALLQRRDIATAFCAGHEIVSSTDVRRQVVNDLPSLTECLETLMAPFNLAYDLLGDCPVDQILHRISHPTDALPPLALWTTLLSCPNKVINSDDIAVAAYCSDNNVYRNPRPKSSPDGGAPDGGAPGDGPGGKDEGNPVQNQSSQATEPFGVNEPRQHDPHPRDNQAMGGRQDNERQARSGDEDPEFMSTSLKLPSTSSPSNPQQSDYSGDKSPISTKSSLQTRSSGFAVDPSKAKTSFEVESPSQANKLAASSVIAIDDEEVKLGASALGSDDGDSEGDDDYINVDDPFWQTVYVTIVPPKLFSQLLEAARPTPAAM